MRKISFGPIYTKDKDGNRTEIPAIKGKDVELDQTLTSEDKAAPAKSVGELASEIKILQDSVPKAYDDTELRGMVGALDGKVDGLHAANLLPYHYYDEKTTKKSGVDFTLNPDGSVLCNGTTTASANYILIAQVRAVHFEPGTYTISGITGGSSSTYQIFVGVDYDDGKSGGWSCYSEPVTFTLRTGGNLRVFIAFTAAGVTVNNVLVKPMLERGSMAHEYVPPVDSPRAVQKLAEETAGEVSELASDLADKLTQPASARIGQYFRVAALDEHGHAVLEAVDLPIADNATGNYGLVKLNTEFGFILSANGFLRPQRATNANIDSKGHENRPIVPSNLDYAVRAGLLSNSQITDADKPQICETIGAVHDGVASVIDDFTLNSDQMYISKSLTALGQPYNFSRVRIALIIPSSETTKGKDIAFGCNVNSNSTAYLADDSILRMSFKLNGNTTGKACVLFDVKCESGMISANTAYSTSIAELDHPNPSDAIRTSNKIILANRITSIVLVAYDGYMPIPSGTRVKIYAM